MKAKRLNWSKQWHDKDVDFWRSNKAQFVRCRRGEKFHSDCVVQTVTHPTKTMISSVISATENYHATSPMIELIPNETTDEPKDLIPPSSNHTSRPGTPQDSTCKRRLALSEELSQLTLAVKATNTAINNYKAHEVSHSFLIAHQLQLQAVYEKD
ncbi:hypothetical protein TNCV_2659141 [Trichonephila clavipes]|nr:hypothetical protein TNCV_2659141 [Trichonephila clavipes]